MTHKKCSNCFQIKPLSEFYRKLDGHQSRCKTCNAEVQRNWSRQKRFKESRAHAGQI